MVGASDLIGIVPEVVSKHGRQATAWLDANAIRVYSPSCDSAQAAFVAAYSGGPENWKNFVRATVRPTGPSTDPIGEGQKDSLVATFALALARKDQERPPQFGDQDPLYGLLEQLEQIHSASTNRTFINAPLLPEVWAQAADGIALDAISTLSTSDPLSRAEEAGHSQIPKPKSVSPETDPFSYKRRQTRQKITGMEAVATIIEGDSVLSRIQLDQPANPNLSRFLAPFRTIWSLALQAGQAGGHSELDSQLLTVCVSTLAQFPDLDSLPATLRRDTSASEGSFVPTGEQKANTIFALAKTAFLQGSRKV